MEKTYLNLLILSVVLALGIKALEDDNTNESSDLHIRKKRLIDRTPGGNSAAAIEDFGHTVNILDYGKPDCAGAIVLVNVILTTAVCVIEYKNTARYQVKSGSSLRNGGVPHDVLRIRHHPEFTRTNIYTGNIALVTIQPAIDVQQSVNRKISLYNGNVSPNTLVKTLVTTSGWGCVHVEGAGPHARTRPTQLRSITVPIISTDQCRNEHLGNGIIQITDEVICTYDASMAKHCSMGDYGNPLVLHDHRGEHLIGILFWTRDDGHPDVYVNLSLDRYKAWIVARLLEIATNPP